jgi:hypothetical protein
MYGLITQRYISGAETTMRMAESTSASTRASSTSKTVNTTSMTTASARKTIAAILSRTATGLIDPLPITVTRLSRAGTTAPVEPHPGTYSPYGPALSRSRRHAGTRTRAPRATDR